jgi:hypothetical protein
MPPRPNTVLLERAWTQPRKKTRHIAPVNSETDPPTSCYLNRLCITGVLTLGCLPRERPARSSESPVFRQLTTGCATWVRSGKNALLRLGQEIARYVLGTRAD